MQDKILSVSDVARRDVFSPAVSTEASTLDQRKDSLMFKLEHYKMVWNKLEVGDMAKIFSSSWYK